VSAFEWLLREAADELAVPLGPLFTADDENWRASIEWVVLAPSLHVFLTDVHAHRDLQVDPKHDRTDQYVAGQVTLAGRADLDFLNGENAGCTRDNALFFRLPGQRALYHLKAGARFHSAGYTLDLERIARLFDGDLPPFLRPLVDPDLRESRCVPGRCDKLMRTLAGTLFARGLTGPLRRMMMEGAVLQLFAAQAAAASGQPLSRPRTMLTPREREAVDGARELLLADMRAPPTIGELAHAVGLSERRLNQGFRILFGATVFETLRNERLEHARHALECGAISLKDVAFRVGYSHVTNFINAYKARFGAPPRSHRGRVD
jgi:AraC-like DNA-binding protein